MMTRESQLKIELESTFAPSYYLLINESAHHSVPKGSESHFKLVIVSERFNELTLLERQRLVYSTLENHFKDGLHALSMQCYTQKEWLLTGSIKESPDCRGGKGK